jgi:ATP-dependent Clp protease ATP-binding subunit ClpC
MGLSAKLPTNFLLWWLIDIPKRLFLVSKRMIILVNNQLSFTLNVRLIFTPLFGDYTWVGHFVGFITRIFQITFGFVFMIVITPIMVILPAMWLLAPLFIYRYIGDIIIPLAILTYFLWAAFTIRRPAKKTTQVTKDKCTRSFRPESLMMVKEAKTDCLKALKKILGYPEIQYLLRICELEDPALIKKLLSAPNFKLDTPQIAAWECAKKQSSRYVEIEHVFLVLITGVQKVDLILSTFGSKLETIENAAGWIIAQREALARLYIWQEDYDMIFTGGIGKGMTGRVTPFLDSISQDFTRQAQKGNFKIAIGREKEIKKIAEILSTSRSNILIVGPPGSGKTTLVRGLAYEIIKGTEYKGLKNKRLVNLEIGGMLAGTKTTGDIATRIKKAIDDVMGSGDIILFIDEVHNLVAGAGDNDAATSAIYSILEPLLSSDKVQCIGATSLQNFRKYIEPNGAFSRLFDIVEITASSKEATLEILKDKAQTLEIEKKVIITYPALVRTVELASKLIHERVMPDKAIDILGRTVTRVSETTRYLTSEDISNEVAEMTHIPVSTITQDEAGKLLHIEDEMKKMVIGQDNAITQIGSALKRGRVGIRDQNKPIASFLFVGTTGVGKTQTAKALAKAYFGDAKNMIRLDMSEYQQQDSINRLIGLPDGSTKGILTESVRTKPFALILLDEIEKAHSQILLTFLQVLDDARLTDGSGQVCDFTNSIIIATSNVGTRSIQEVFGRNGSFTEMKETAMKDVREKFAPEFLNRFSGIIVFNPLSMDNVRSITGLMLNSVKAMADEKGIKVKFSDELVNEIIKRGYNPEWGARPLARVVEDTVESYLAVKMLSNGIKQGDDITLGTEVIRETADTV